MNIKNRIKLKVTSCILADFIALREATTISAPIDMPDHSREYFSLRTKKNPNKIHENEGLLEARVSPLPDKGHLFLLTTQAHKGKEKEKKNKTPLTECWREKLRLA